ncbi:MAG: hypothetical protein R2771_15625 [Saprospiraceae bacterium]
MYINIMIFTFEDHYLIKKRSNTYEKIYLVILFGITCQMAAFSKELSAGMDLYNLYIWRGLDLGGGGLHLFNHG